MWIETLSWMQVAGVTQVAMFLIKIPPMVCSVIDNSVEEIRRSDAANRRIKVASDDSYERNGLSLYSLLLIATMIGACFFDWFKWSQITPEINETIARVGVMLAALSLVLHSCAHVSLGKAWSGFVSVQKNHKLVTSGMYRVARHPMYSCMLLHSLAVFMITQNWLVGSVVCIPALYGIYRIKREEMLMIELFGQTYIDYHSRVGALWPWKVFRRDLGLTRSQMERILADRDGKDD